MGASANPAVRPPFGRRSKPPVSAAYFPPTPSDEPGRATPVFDIRSVIARTFALTGRNGVTFLALVAAAALPNRLAYHMLDPRGATFLLIYYLTTFIVCAPLYIAVFTGARRSLDGQPVTFGACLRAGLLAPWAAMRLSFITSLSVWFLFIVPGFWLAARWCMAAPIALTEGVDMDTAMARSAALTAPRRIAVCVLTVLLAGMAITRALPMLGIWGIPVEGLVAFMFGNWLFALLLTAFTAAASAALYHELLTTAPATKPVN